MYYTYDTKTESENNNQHVFTTKYDEMYNSNNFVSEMKESASRLVQIKKFDSKNEKFEMNEIVIQRLFAVNSITIFANSKYDSKSNVDQSAKIYTIETRKKKKRMKHDDETFDVKKEFAAKSFEFIEKTSATTSVKKKKKKIKKNIDKFKKLKKINVLKNKFPINVQKILKNNTIIMTIIQLCAISSFFKNEFKRLIFASRKSRKKQISTNTEISRVDLTQVDLSTLKSNIKKMTRE